MALLERYDQLIAKDYCRPGCGECLDRCPSGVPVDDILRYAMYFENYGRERDAMAKYARAAGRAQRDALRELPAPCQAACPFDIPIRDKLLRFHRLLTMA